MTHGAAPGARREAVARATARELASMLDPVARADGLATWSGPAADRFRLARARWQRVLQADADGLAATALTSTHMRTH